MSTKKERLLPPARALALDTLGAILNKNRDLQSELDARLKATRISPKDAALATELVYGYLRLKDRVEAILAKFLKDPAKLPPRARLAIGLAAYELLFLDRVPAYASVDWCVGFIKKQFSMGLGKLANAVLRNIDRLGETAHSPSVLKADGNSTHNASGHNVTDLNVVGSNISGDDSDSIPADPRTLSLWYSCPEWIVSMWLAAYGEERTIQYLEAAIAPAPLGLRVNRVFGIYETALDEDAEDVDEISLKQLSRRHKGKKHDHKPAAKTADIAENRTCETPDTEENELQSLMDGIVALYGADADTAEADTTFQELSALETCSETRGYGLMFPPGSIPSGLGGLINSGKVSRQSMASQEVLSVTEPNSWQGPVWDCCCGRGGKTTALLEAGIPVVLASDTSRQRVLGLRDEIERLGLIQPVILQASATEPPREGLRPRTILADVPCSGLGTLSRRPDARYHRTPEGIADLVITQSAILRNAWQHLEAGGKLVYITCTVNPAENEEQVAAFLKDHPEAQCVLEWNTPPDSPYREFFYAAVLKKA